MRLYVSNAFSLSMLDRSAQKGNPMGYTPRVSDEPLVHARVPRPVDDPRSAFSALSQGREVVSVVGHANTAAILGQALGVDLATNRVSVKLAAGDTLLVGQYIGPRLPEGATELPEGATIEWWLV